MLPRQFEAISGPWELLLDDRADLILHHVELGDTRFETIFLRRVRMILSQWRLSPF